MVDEEQLAELVREKPEQRKKQLEKLRNVEEWNQWRESKKKPDVRIDLKYASLSNAFLRGVNLSFVDLNESSLNNADLFGANLLRADISNADLSEANLTNAYLRGVNLKDATLSRTHAINTDFAGATLTGACIEDWNTNSRTNLDGVICEYIYLDFLKQERYPLDRNFRPGEFALIFKTVNETLDRYLREGIPPS